MMTGGTQLVYDPGWGFRLMTVLTLTTGTALLMWLPIAGPFPELRFSLPVQMIFLFLQSIIPTVPAGTEP